MIQGQTPCIICRSDYGAHKAEKLRRIRDLLQGADNIGSQRHVSVSMYLEIHDRCRYGLYCNKIQQNQERGRLYAKEIENLINNGAKISYDILQLLRGDFPMAYRLLEMESSLKN